MQRLYDRPSLRTIIIMIKLISNNGETLVYNIIKATPTLVGEAFIFYL